MGAKSTRNIAKDKIVGSLGNLEWAQDKMAWIIETYLELHPEIGEPAIAVCEALDQIKIIIRQIDEMI